MQQLSVGKQNPCYTVQEATLVICRFSLFHSATGFEETPELLYGQLYLMQDL